MFERYIYLIGSHILKRPLAQTTTQIRSKKEKGGVCSADEPTESESHFFLRPLFRLKMKGHTEIVLPAFDIDFARRILKTQRSFVNADSDI